MNKTSIILIFCLLLPVMMLAQQALIITAPVEVPHHDARMKIFLGGSIDMGTAENWQKNIEDELLHSDVIILNPRRNDWNKEWKPIASDPNFRKQVEWELEALESADIIIMYFAPTSQSPISLLELGLYARSGKMMVVCPEGFWRKGNVDIVSEKYDIDTFSDLNTLMTELKKRINAAKPRQTE